MPEISFYITDNERKELFDFIKEKEGVFIPDLIYDKQEPIRIQSKDELIKCIYEQAIGFYVVSPCFQKESLALTPFSDKYADYRNKYFIKQRSGGPYIRFSFFRGFATDAYIKCQRTELFYYARYLHLNWEAFANIPNADIEFKASDELKSYYKMIVIFLKSKCRQITAKNGKKYWVSKTLKEEDVI